MKKLLLSFFALAAMSFAANADSATLQFGTAYNSGKVSAYTATWSATCDGVKWNIANFNNNNNGWNYVKCGRKGNASVATIINDEAFANPVVDITMTIDAITAANVNSIKVYTSATSDFASVIETKEFNKATGSQSVTLELAQANLFYKLEFDCASGSANGLVTLSKVVYTFGEAGNPDDTRELSGLAYETSSVSVYEDDLDAFDAPALINPNNLTVAYESSNETVAEVDETTGEVTLTGDPGEATITATFAGNTEFREGTASYKITVLPALPKVNSVKETIALNTENTTAIPCRINYDLTVAFVSYNNVFACDADGDFIQLYGANSYKAGSVIPAGWAGNYVFYSKTTPEITPVAGGAFPASTETADFTPKAVDPAEITTAFVNNVVLIENVDFAEATPAAKENFEGTVGETAYTFRNNYTLASVEAGKYDVTVVITVYQSAVQFYVVNYTPVVETGINEITVDEAADDVYYNLQGIRVANPRNGIFIHNGRKILK